MDRVYENICWSCGDEISSLKDRRCNICGWYICSRCGACQKNACIGKLCFNPEDRRFLRKEYANLTIQLKDQEFEKWGKALLRDYHNRQIEEERKKVRDEEAEKKAAAEKKYNEIYNYVMNNKNVNHSVFGPGTVEEIIPGEYEMIKVYFPEINETKRFRFPDAFINENFIY